MTNELNWKKVEFVEHNPDEKKQGYVFTVDGKVLEYDGFEPLCDYDIDCAAFLEESDEIDSCPPVACCACGCVECDSIRTFIEFFDDKILWTVFEANICGSKESVMSNHLGKYSFSKEQYFKSIDNLAKS